MNRYLLAVALPLSCVAAQDAPPVFVPTVVPAVRMRCAGLPELREQWPTTAIGRLFADPDMEELVETASAWLLQQEQHNIAVYKAAVDLQVELDDIDVRKLCNAGNPLGALSASFDQVRRFEFFVTMATPGQQQFVRPLTATVVSCLPQHEGRWTRAFEDVAQLHRRSTWFDELEAAKVDGYSAYRFQPRKAATGEQPALLQGIGRWQLHLPGTFIYGSGLPKELGSVEIAPQKDPAGIVMDIGIKGYMRPFLRGADLPEGFGLELLQRLQLRESFDGDQLLEEIELILSPGVERTGLVGALLNGDGELAPQALPKGAIAQVRFAVAYEQLFDAVVELVKDEFGGKLPLPDGVVADIKKALDGSVSIGACAPAPGGLIPRIYLTLGLADADAFDRILKWGIDAGLPTKNTKLSGHEVTNLRIPDMPQGIMPAFCRVDDKLHIAESGRSLRAFLKAQKTGAIAMDVGDLEPVAGAGELVKGFETRFDLAQLYRSFYVNWLSLLELSMGGDMVIGKHEMPEPDLVEEFAGKLLGTVRRTGDSYVLRHRGATGGPVVSGYLMMWGAVLQETSNDRNTSVLLTAMAKTRLEKLARALEKFELREDRLPKDLAELVVAEKLVDDALVVMPGKFTEEVVLPSGKKVMSSFRYYPNGVRAKCLQNEPAVLIEIAPRRYSRQFLGREGTVKRCYFLEESKYPIDLFGK